MRLAGFGVPSTGSATTPGSTTTPSISVSSAISKYNRRSERRLSLTANPKLNTIHEPNGSSSLAPASGQSNEDQANTLSSKSRSISLMDGKIICNKRHKNLYQKCLTNIHLKIIFSTIHDVPIHNHSLSFYVFLMTNKHLTEPLSIKNGVIILIKSKDKTLVLVAQKHILLVNVNIIGSDEVDYDTTLEKSVDQTRKSLEDESGYYDEDDKILRDNNRMISSMKDDGIKLETYDRVFNRSFTNPIGYKFNGKSLESIS